MIQPESRLNNNIWVQTNKAPILQYLQTVTDMPYLDIDLPSPQDVAAAGGTNVITPMPTDIDGLVVANNVNLHNEAYVRVGQRIHVRSYQVNEVGTTKQHRCPLPAFAFLVLRDLARIATTVSGRRLLHSIDSHGGQGHFVKIVYGHGMVANASQANPTGGQAAFLQGNGQPGAPVSSEVMYNPAFFGVPVIPGTSQVLRTISNSNDPCVRPGKWAHPAQKPADVTLFHELVHADDMLRGIFIDTELRRGTRNVKISESRAVGLDAFNNSSIYSENSYRHERNFVLRDCYGEATEVTKQGPTIDADYTRLLAYLDTELMDYGTFKQASSHMGSRNKILTVEAALDHYNRSYSWRTDPADDELRMEQLVAVMRSCEDYKQRASAKRNVRALVTAANDEILAIVNRAIAASQPNAPTRASFEPLRRLSYVLERGERTVMGAMMDGVVGPTEVPAQGRAGGDLALIRGFTLVPAIKNLQNALGPRQAPVHAEIGALQQQDLTDLDTIAQDVAAPATTRAIVANLVAIARQPTVQLWDAGATSNAGLLNPGPGYYVNYGQWNTRDMRLGTFIHELTHVANHQTWANTVEMFSYAGDISPQVSTTRKNNLQALLALVTTLDAYERYWLGVKLNYGHTNVKGDYETVLNQSLIYVHLWGIPQHHPFHALLLQHAQAAYNVRRLAAQAQVVQPPPPQVQPPPPQVQPPPPRQPSPLIGRGRSTSVHGERPSLLGSGGRARSKSNPLL